MTEGNRRWSSRSPRARPHATCEAIRRPPPPFFGGFSLVELVIVVVIIGVIAGIAATRFASGARRTEENALIASLSAMRRAIDMYAAEHNGVFPGAAADGLGGGANSAASFVSQLTRHSAVNGDVANAYDPGHTLGPYLRAIPPVPVGPYSGSTTVIIDNVNSPPVVLPGPDGWVYNPTTGEIIANTDAANEAGTRAYDEY
jgi:prepilin-type N-terminal cleavage/methylation domain-containing protein